jgi:hypothetical protein
LHADLFQGELFQYDFKREGYGQRQKRTAAIEITEITLLIKGRVHHHDAEAVVLFPISKKKKKNKDTSRKLEHRGIERTRIVYARCLKE